MGNLTDEVKEKARKLGADLVGIAPVERFKGAPYRMSPRGILPEAKSVIVVAIHHLDASVELGGEPTPHDFGPYAGQSSVMNPKLDDISFLLARFLEDKGYKTVPITASNIWRYYGYKDLEVNFAPDLAHRYAAVAAGLGEIGWSGLCLTPEFGPRQRFVSIITEAELVPSPMYSGDPLCDRCMECVKNCPTDAFRKEVRRINKIEIGGKIFEFPDTNKWRCAWAENFGLSLAHSIPDKVNEDVVLQYLEKYGRHAGEEGYCLKFCMIPQRRYYDFSYCRGPRRRKEKSNATPEELTEKIIALGLDDLVDVIAIESKEKFINDVWLHPEYHLPDVESIISIGIRSPSFIDRSEDLRNTIIRRLEYATFDIAHFIDLSGYSSVTKTRISDILVAQRLGVYEPDIVFSTILTSAKLLPKVKKEQAISKSGKTIKPKEIKDFCLSCGADLVGFFNKERYEEFLLAFQKVEGLPREIEEVIDTGPINGGFIPQIIKRTLKVKELEEWLPGAQSVIVLGLHFPNAPLDIAKTTPAETIGPYAFVQYESLRLLSDIAYKVIKFLNKNGYQATLTFDLTGFASSVKNSRGMIPDMRANSFAAFLAGLGYLGVNGILITKEYGTRQRLVAIVTDLPLPNDPLYQGEILCENCIKPCIESCPTSAISNTTKFLNIEGRSFPLPQIDSFSCDWAKRYCLSGEEGPFYFGVNVDLSIPRNKRVEEVAEAVSKVKWGVQKLHLNIVEECLRKCIARGSGM